MKKEDFDNFLKLAVEDFEKEGKVDFNEKAVWNKVNRSSKNKRHLLFIAASLFLFAISFSLIYNFNMSIKKQISDNKTNKKSVPQLRPKIKNEVIENVIIAKRSKKLSEPEAITPALAHEKKPIDIIKKENLIDSKKTMASVISPVTTSPNQVFLSVQFKRGTKQVTTEKQELKSEPTFTLSFKKAKPEKNMEQVNNSIASNDTNKNIYKIKF